MARLIDADALEEHLAKCVSNRKAKVEASNDYETHEYHLGKMSGYVNAKRIVADAPTIDPVKHGVWLKYPGTLVSDDGLWGETLCDCSECGWTKRIVTDFCPKCGANMVLNGEIQVRWKDAAD